MPGVACPHCYVRVEPRGLWYRCAGRGSAGRAGCAPAEDLERRRLTGYAGLCLPSYPPLRQGVVGIVGPACPDCGGESGRRVCPNCHTPVPADFGQSASPLVGLVGAKGTGKSVYLAVLARELTTSTRRRFDADVRLSGDRRSDQASSRDWLQQNVEAVYAEGHLPPQTPAAVNGRREPVVFQWRQEYRGRLRSRLRTSHLSFYDTAGEDLASQEGTHDLNYLGAADALIVLLDPFMLPRARASLGLPDAALTSADPAGDVLNRVTRNVRDWRHLQDVDKLKLPVAVAFAKIDAFLDLLGPDHPLLRAPEPSSGYDEQAGEQTHEYVLGLLHDLGADGIDAHLRLNYANFRYFAISSLGAPPDYELGRIDPGGVRPLRVDEPLLWLLSHFGVIPVRGRR